MGAITGAIGSLVTAYFGIQLGSSGNDRADGARARSDAAAKAALAYVAPADASKVAQTAHELLTTGSTARGPAAQMAGGPVEQQEDLSLKGERLAKENRLPEGLPKKADGLRDNNLRDQLQDDLQGNLEHELVKIY